MGMRFYVVEAIYRNLPCQLAYVLDAGICEYRKSSVRGTKNIERQCEYTSGVDWIASHFCYISFQ
jgi:hypothetical protein